MIIRFGLALDQGAQPLPKADTIHQRHLGPQGLLALLETFCGLSRPDVNTEFIRVEEYRQGLKAYLQQHPEAFYAASFAADQFATATDLLQRRDELLLAGWAFNQTADMPARLRTLAEIEHLLSQRLSPGSADRFIEVIAALPTRKHPIREVRLCDPWELLDPHLQQLLTALQVPLQAPPENVEAHPSSDLQKLQQGLRNRQPQGRLTADGSLLLLRAKRDTDLAIFVAGLLRKNPKLQPTVLAPGQSITLENALYQQGLPNIGISSASLARPTLQILKLATVFLWKPIDPYIILQFVSLSVKPLEEELANRIGQQIAIYPGLMGDGWQQMIGQYFRELETGSLRDPKIDPEEVRFQYRFWFERKRYEASQLLPKTEPIDIYNYLHQWARRAFEASGGKNNTLLILSEQARQIRDLLRALPEQELGQLELERIVRTIYEPAPMQFYSRQKDGMPLLSQPHGLVDNVEQVLWWNFAQEEPDFFFARWYTYEQDYLSAVGVTLTGPQQENQRLNWQRQQPVLRCSQQLLLVTPEAYDGREVLPHPLMGELDALFDNLDAISIDIEREPERKRLQNHVQTLGTVSLEGRQLGQPRPYLSIRQFNKLQLRDEETVTSLETLLYYPYQWMFRHKLRLRKSAILSIVPDNTLMGNLAHRVFELLLQQENLHNWTQEELNQWVDREANALLQRQGVVLLMYGREPDRVAFIRNLRRAAWSLLSTLRDNAWEVLATEQDLEGEINGTRIKARADLILQRDQELAIVDLKWRGYTRRRDLIRNQADLQLVLYGYLQQHTADWPHTAYYIMERCQMLARNTAAFGDVVDPILPDADHRQINEEICSRLGRTLHWRKQQLQQGKIEVRCHKTHPDLMLEAEETALEILEMKEEDAPFDDYRTLINLIR